MLEPLCQGALSWYNHTFKFYTSQAMYYVVWINRKHQLLSEAKMFRTWESAWNWYLTKKQPGEWGGMKECAFLEEAEWELRYHSKAKT